MAERVEFRSEAVIEGDTLVGLAHVYGERALIGGNHYETFAEGAFDEAMKTSDVRAFYEHDRGKLLGRQKSGTLRLRAEKNALAYEIDLPHTTYGEDLRELVRRGDIAESSFGFIPGKYEWRKAPDGKPERRHLSVASLVDVSPVAIPAFSGTAIQLRSDGFADESARSQTARARARARGVGK